MRRAALLAAAGGVVALFSLGGFPAAASGAHHCQGSEFLARHDGAALQPLRTAQSELAVTDAHLATIEQRVDRDRQRLARDAVNAYVYAIPDNETANLFDGSAPKADASSEYADAAAGNISADEAALNAQLSQLSTTEGRWQSQERQASAVAHHSQALRSPDAVRSAAPSVGRTGAGRP